MSAALWVATGARSRPASTGSVSGYRYVGGLVGSGASIETSFWDIQTSGQAISPGGVGLTTAEMMDPEMLGLNGLAGDPNWVVDAHRDYPHLAWEGTPGDMVPEPVIDWLSGDGIRERPYELANVDQLLRLSKAGALADKHFKLTNDFDLSDRIWPQAVIPYFNGRFDGSGRLIHHLTIRGASRLGFFGRTGEDALITNFGLEAADVNGTGGSIGGLVGDNYGEIITCSVAGTIVGNGSVGGLVGWNYGSITMSHSTGTVSRLGGSPLFQRVGGFVGFNGGVITNCHSTSTVSGRDASSFFPPGPGSLGPWDYVGGLVGENCDGSITNCYSTGTASGAGDVGGLVGWNFAGSITNCYSTGTVSGHSDYVGGLVGSDACLGELCPSITTMSCWDVETSGQPSSDGGTGLTTAEMQTASTFLDAGWDFVDETENGPNDVWKMWDGYDYPRLACEPGPNTPLVFVDVNDPGFRGQMSRYEVTNAQYCDFLNAALASGDITMNDTDIYGSSGSNSGEDYIGQRYYRCDGSGYTGYGATNGGAARIHYSAGAFAVDKGFGDHPVTYVSWYGATAFADYYGYSLPTEDQWQAVADYDGTYTYGCGETIDPGIANYRYSEHPDGTMPVGSFGGYGYGMSDMAGNVWEWTSSSLGSNRVFRGGSLGSVDSDCAVSIRGDGIPYANYYDIGFRVCR